ncbi:MAG TPA: ParB N-terminal domain-containing protein [Candidatus Paceibacterota bacterium]|nr:ParB N-terminal domain-containing protein [Candidatus Paceibacterota bacterium]
MTERDTHIRLLNPRALRPHEEIRIPHALMVLVDILFNRSIKHPLLVDQRTGVILDGHHRWWASKQLGLDLVPCYCVDYLHDGKVICESWRPEVQVDKERVLAKAKQGLKYPPKTSKHIYTLPPHKPYSFHELRLSALIPA